MNALNTVLVAALVLAMTPIFACTPQSKTETASISGTVELTPELQKKLKAQAVLYLIARNASEPLGPPLAVRRFIQPLTFPLNFTLSKQDTMIPDSPFEGSLSITARIAQTGSASPAKKGDIEGSAQKNPVQVGAMDVKIFLDRVRP